MSDPTRGNTVSADRRSFLKHSTILSAGICGLVGGMLHPEPAAAASDPPGLDIIGPKPGYSSQVGTLVSMLTWMREANGIITATKGLTQADLDHLFDAKANTIGALMLHLAATETYYQMNTFDGMKWDSWSRSIKDKWDPAMNLGDAGRKTIKGHDRDYYLNILQEVRAKSLAEFKKHDDAWLMAVDEKFPWVRPTTTASGSTYASTSPTTPARSRSCANACPEPSPTQSNLMK